jgi:hypothetical protein
MRTFAATSVILVCAFVCGCGSLLRVKPFDPNKPEGIPFFIKQGVCNHQSVYGNPYWRLTLKVSNDSGTLAMETLNINNTDHGGLEFNELLHELEKAAPDQDSVMNAWNNLKKLARFDPWKQNEDRLLLENTSSLTSVVDYSTKYSINQSKPFSGSSNADFKLSADGTLNEASGQVQDNTFSTILSALPISTLITSAAGIATKTGAAANEPSKEVKFSLTQEQRYIKTSYSQYMIANQTICPVGKALTDAEQNIGVSISDVGANTLQTDSNQDKNSDSITVTGTIKLPKSLQAAPPANNSSKEQKAGSNGADGQSVTAPSSTQPKDKKN